IEIAVRLRGHIEAQIVVTGLGLRLDVDVMERDDPRQSGDPAHELAELVEGPGEAQLEGLLGIEVLLHLRTLLKELLLQAGREPGLGDVDEQIRHFRLARELPQQRAEGALDVLQLLLVDLQVHRLRVLGPELLAQLLLVLLKAIELRALVLPDEHVREEHREHHEPDPDGSGAHGERPAPRIARVERAQLLDESVHRVSSRRATRLSGPVGLPGSSMLPAWLTCSASRTKLEPRPSPFFDSTTSSAGFLSHSEESMLRMKEETRVLDCAMPSNLMCIPDSLMLVRYTPSGSVRTMVSNRCTISGRERCSFSMMSMRAMKRCLSFSRLLISSISLSRILICARSTLLRRCCALTIESMVR